MRLQSLEASETGSAFVLFNDDREPGRADSPSGERVRLIRQGKRVAGPRQGGAYQLYPRRAMCSSPASGRCFTGDSAPESNPTANDRDIKNPVAGNGFFFRHDQLPRVANRLCSRLPRETHTGVMEGASTRSPEDSTK